MPIAEGAPDPAYKTNQFFVMRCNQTCERLVIDGIGERQAVSQESKETRYRTDRNRSMGTESLPFFLLDVYAKGEKVDLSQEEKSTLKRVLQRLVETYRSKHDE